MLKVQETTRTIAYIGHITKMNANKQTAISVPLHYLLLSSVDYFMSLLSEDVAGPIDCMGETGFCIGEIAPTYWLR